MRTASPPGRVPSFAGGLLGLAGGFLRLAGLAALVGLLVNPEPASAHEETWRTLETEHFDIHFPDGGYEVAVLVAGYMEAAHTRLAPLLGHRPRLRTQVVLTDDVDTANGSARVVPYPLVRGFMYPPTVDSLLNHYDDHLWLLMVHEYAHILHLDNARGIPELGNRIFGRIFTPNHLQPRWGTEGIATWYESLLSAGGRNESSLADMMLRAQVLDEGRLWPIDRVTGNPYGWPGGHPWYLFGGRVWAHLAAELGEVVGTAIPEDLGGQVLPYAINVSADRAVGMSFNEAWARWTEAEEGRQADVIASLREAGVLAGERITAIGRTVRAPRWTPAGDALLAFVASGEAYPGIFRFDADPALPSSRADGRPILRVPGGGTFDLSPDGSVLVHVASEPFRLEQHYQDLFAAPVDGGPSVRLTYGMRARDPALSADGTRLAFVANRRSETAVYVAAIRLRPGHAGGAPEVHLGAPVRVFQRAGVHVDRPAFSPDGRQLVFSATRADPGRDLVLLDLGGLRLPAPTLVCPIRGTGPKDASLRPDEPAAESGSEPPVVRLTDDGAQDVHPVFDRSGRYVLFSSDRSGIYDLYAQPIAAGRADGPPRRITRTLTGAFEPRQSPDGAVLAYVTYGAAGYDLGRMPFDPDGWLDPPEAPAAKAPLNPRPARLYPVRPYRPWASLRPYHWIPFMGVDRAGPTVGVSTNGADAIGDHRWAASAWIGTSSGVPGYNARYTYGGLFSTLSVGSSRSEYLASAAHIRDGRRRTYAERAWRLSGSADLPLPAADRRQALTLSLIADHRRVLSGIFDFDPAEPPPTLPRTGLSTRARLAWSASSVQRFPEGHAPYEGTRLRLAAETSTRSLGGDFDFLQLTGGATAHHRLPFTEAQVLAANLEVGAGVGDFGGRSLYVLGGLPVDDPLFLIQTLGGGRIGGPVLRGYRPFSLPGDAYVVGNLEHRFPLLGVERGAGTLPIFLRRVHGALFLDAGAVAPGPTRFAEAPFLAGVGGEVRAEILLGYAILLDLRLGLARGFGPAGETAPYFGVGSAF
jgi:Tol biopolymer transport system component